MTDRCPECGAPFTTRSYGGTAEEHPDNGPHRIVRVTDMTVRCANGHRWQVTQMVRKMNRMDEYELGKQV